MQNRCFFLAQNAKNNKNKKGVETNMAQKRTLAVPKLVQRSDVAVEIERRKQAARAREEESMKEASRREAPKVRIAAGPEGSKGVRLVEQVRWSKIFHNEKKNSL